MDIEPAWISAFASSVGAICASVAAWSAAKALKANVRTQKHALNATRIDAGERLMDHHLPELALLHGLRIEEIRAANITDIEFLYLLHSFSAGDIFYRVGDDKTLTPYRKNLLNQQKVRDAWKKLFKGRFINGDGRFAKLVDGYISQSSLSRN